MSTFSFRNLGIVTCVVASFGMVGFAQINQKQFQQKKIEPMQHMEHNEMLQACAKACSDCQRSCDMCATHCSHMLAEGKKDHLTTLASCQDCSTICAAASQVVARGGPFASTICTACADCCAKCATNCEKFPNDKHMKACAEECRKCETACHDMMKHTSK